MSAPFRIVKADVRGEGDEAFRQYLERLLKLIPGEVVGVYMVGSGFIPPLNRVAAAIWAAICLVLVIIVRRYGTADPEAGLPPQPVPVAISATAFVIWIYWLGGPFAQFGLHISYVGSLLVLVWSFLVPYFYKGQDET
jgi:hypothetical protein